MIKYSTYMHGNPGKPEEPEKAYATAQVTEKVSLSKFAKHISDHNSVYDKGDVMAILTKAVGCLREMLLAGKKVEMGDLGEFFVSLKSTGAESLEKFNPDNNITAVCVKWTPGEAFGNLVNEAEFEYALTRKSEAEAKKVEKKRAVVTAPGDTDTPSGTEGNGSTGSDTNDNTDSSNSSENTVVLD